jgi:hypothetical protein
MRVAGFDVVDLAGGLLVAIGGVALMLGAASYPIGTLHRMGPGYLPLVTGAVLTCMGIALLIAGRATVNELPSFSFRPPLAIFAGLIFFALTIERFGVGPSTAGMVVLTSLAQERPSWRIVALTAAFLIVMSIGIFIYILNIPLHAIRY